MRVGQGGLKEGEGLVGTLLVSIQSSPCLAHLKPHVRVAGPPGESSLGDGRRLVESLTVAEDLKYHPSRQFGRAPDVPEGAGGILGAEPTQVLTGKRDDAPPVAVSGLIEQIVNVPDDEPRVESAHGKRPQLVGPDEKPVAHA